MEQYERIELGEHEYSENISISDTLLFDGNNCRMNFEIAQGIWTINAVRNKKTKCYYDLLLFNKECGSNILQSNKNLFVESASGFLLLSETDKHKDKHKDNLQNTLKYTECLEEEYTIKVFKDKIAFKVKAEEKYPIQCSAFAGLITGIKIQLIDYHL